MPKREIVFRLVFPESIKRRYLIAMAVGILGIALVARAAPMIPNMFNPGDKLSSKALNDNFTALQSAIPTVTPWVPWTPLMRAGTGTGAAMNQKTTGMWRRVGDSIEVRVSTSINGAPDGSGTWFWDLPNNLQVDYSKLVGFGVPSGHGSAYSSQNLPSQPGDYHWLLMVFPRGPGSLAALGHNQGSFVTATSPIAFKSGDAVNLSATVPIVGWDVSN